MQKSNAIKVFSVLAQATRLEALRLRLKHGPEGLPAGEVAGSLDVPYNTMSTHLAILTHASLLSAKRYGRSMIYRVELKAIRQLVLFLHKDCRGGQPTLCAPLLADIYASCPKQPSGYG